MSTLILPETGRPLNHRFVLPRPLHSSPTRHTQNLFLSPPVRSPLQGTGWCFHQNNTIQCTPFWSLRSKELFGLPVPVSIFPLYFCPSSFRFLKVHTSSLIYNFTPHPLLSLIVDITLTPRVGIVITHDQYTYSPT